MLTSQTVQSISQLVVSHMLAHEAATRQQRITTTAGARRGFTRSRIDIRDASGISLELKLAQAFPMEVIEAGGVPQLLQQLAALGQFRVTATPRIVAGKPVLRRDGTPIVDTHVTLLAQAFSPELRTLTREELQAASAATTSEATGALASAAEIPEA